MCSADRPGGSRAVLPARTFTQRARNCQKNRSAGRLPDCRRNGRRYI
jgi:hypothetical protein